MDKSVARFRDALDSLDRVSADTIFQSELRHLTPSQAVAQLVVPALQLTGQARCRT